MIVPDQDKPTPKPAKRIVLPKKSSLLFFKTMGIVVETVFP